MAPIFCSKFLKLLNQTKFQEKCRNHENCNFFSKENLSFRGVVVITLVSYTRGPQFKPGWGLNPFDTLPQHSVMFVLIWDMSKFLLEFAQMDFKNELVKLYSNKNCEFVQKQENWFS